MENAIFAAGCFWGIEAAFRRVDGVVDAAVGYAGGTAEEPTYEQVCTGKTGHAEVVQVTFDPERVSFDQLLDVFWGVHDPTTLNRQGPDVGSQYRSAVFYLNDGQKAAAEASKEKVEQAGIFAGPVVTEITAAGPFWRAEGYHQRYIEKNRRRTGGFF
jgi:peptide-methionine (S)-S-oxide reductase